MIYKISCGKRGEWGGLAMGEVMWIIEKVWATCAANHSFAQEKDSNKCWSCRLALKVLPMVPLVMMVMMTQKMRHTANKVTEISRFVARHVLGNEASNVCVWRRHGSNKCWPRGGIPGGERPQPLPHHDMISGHSPPQCDQYHFMQYHTISLKVGLIGRTGMQPQLLWFLDAKLRPRGFQRKYLFQRAPKGDEGRGWVLNSPQVNIYEIISQKSVISWRMASLRCHTWTYVLS